MSRRRRYGDGIEAKRRRRDGSPGAVEAALGALGALFPIGLFGDLLPPLVLRHQLYSIVSDRTAVDRHLDRLRADGRIRLLHVGLGSDTLGVVCVDAYREKVLAGAAGSPRAPLIRRFLDGAVAASPALGYEERELKEWGFGDRDITQLVAAGLLTLRDAGSWWLSVPGLGRFIRAILRGRGAILSRLRRARHRELLLEELQERRAPPGAAIGLSFILHDLLGAQLVLSVPTTSGPMLRLAEP
ncbi:inactive serine/threonine-protein kinase 19 [Neopsephotus bourkii]|uniref:inactive serine/threonine-protein kinase 19 n=1 Tax=Neopsephotus bourkii TaxID=309878 RepID=UPI002AA55343|nr:inactive serine/threonine-protein kinase 19 [Neopsephotus bourkii]